MSPPEQRARTLAALQDLLLAEAREKPLVIVYEDLHWADPTSLDFLSGFLAASRAAPLMVIATTRPGNQLEWTAHDGVTTLQIERLTARRFLLVCQRRGHRTRCRPFRRRRSRIVARTDGVPLFVEEMTRMMLGSPDRTRRGDLPESLSDLLTERLDRLGPARRLMQVSAVIGREFTPELLARVTNRRVEELGRVSRRSWLRGWSNAGRAASSVSARVDPGRCLWLAACAAATGTAWARRGVPDRRLPRGRRART